MDVLLSVSDVRDSWQFMVSLEYVGGWGLLHIGPGGREGGVVGFQVLDVV